MNRLPCVPCIADGQRWEEVVAVLAEPEVLCSLAGVASRRCVYPSCIRVAEPQDYCDLVCVVENDVCSLLVIEELPGRRCWIGKIWPVENPVLSKHAVHHPLP